MSLVSASRGTAVGIPTGYGLDDQEVGVRVSVVTNVLFSTAFRPALEPTETTTQ
jgi:hypothetical protein